MAAVVATQKQHGKVAISRLKVRGRLAEDVGKHVRVAARVRLCMGVVWQQEQQQEQQLCEHPDVSSSSSPDLLPSLKPVKGQRLLTPMHPGGGLCPHWCCAGGAVRGRTAAAAQLSHPRPCATTLHPPPASACPCPCCAGGAVRGCAAAGVCHPGATAVELFRAPAQARRHPATAAAPRLDTGAARSCSS